MLFKTSKCEKTLGGETVVSTKCTTVWGTFESLEMLGPEVRVKTVYSTDECVELGDRLAQNLLFIFQP